MDLFLRLDSWLSALIFSLLMLVAWWVGDHARPAASRPTEESGQSRPSTRIEDAILALFALLLAFCFAGAAARYEERKQGVLEDALAIGSFATVASLLEEPERSAMHREIRAYVEQRLVFGNTDFDDPEMQRVLREARASHERMRRLVSAAVTRKNAPSVHPPLVSAFNEMTDAAERRHNRLREHVPESIIFMLVLFGAFAAYTMGRLRDARPCAVGGRARIVAYALLVGLVFFVTIDLEQPGRGFLRASPLPMEELRSALSSPGLAP